MKLSSRESAESYKIKFLLFTLGVFLHGQRGGEVFVEGEEVFYALAVAGEGVFAVAAVHGAVEGFVGFVGFVGFGEGGRHRHGVVEIR